MPNNLKTFFVRLGFDCLGGSIAKKQPFECSDPNFRGQKLLVLTSIHCSKTLNEINCTLKHLTCVTSVTDVIREMFEQKMCRVCRNGGGKKKCAKNIHDGIGACLHITFNA